MTEEFDPELDMASAVVQAIDARLRDVWTSVPGVVTAWDAARQLATVEPTLRDPDGAKLPAVLGVRVVQPLAGALGLALPVAPGVGGLLVCCAIDPSGWLLRGGNPADVRSQARHKLSYAVFLPGVGPSAPNTPSKPTIGNLAHTAHPIALGDQVQAVVDVLHSILSAVATPPPTEPVMASLMTAWKGVFGTSPVPSPTMGSSDAEVTT